MHSVQNVCDPGHPGDPGPSLVWFKSDPLAAFTFWAQWGSDTKMAWNRGVGLPTWEFPFPLSEMFM